MRLFVEPLNRSLEKYLFSLGFFVAQNLISKILQTEYCSDVDL